VVEVDELQLKLGPFLAGAAGLGKLRFEDRSLFADGVNFAIWHRGCLLIGLSGLLVGNRDPE
jgi:hypothetical protein